jgi:hypothetical protein
VSDHSGWRRALSYASILALAARSTLAAAPGGEYEQFDLTGLPEMPTSFLEQQIRARVADHRPGDEEDAAVIQRKLARAYQEKGDLDRAGIAGRRAGSAGGSSALPLAVARDPAAALSPSDAAPPAASISSVHEVAPAAGAIPALPPAAVATPAVASQRADAFHGRFYGTIERTLHTWDFSRDGTFLHTTIASGAGTSVRNSERGRFRLEGDALVLEVESTAGGFVTPAVGARTAQIGASSGASASTRRLTLTKVGPDASGGIVLAGARLRPKNW